MSFCVNTVEFLEVTDLGRSTKIVNENFFEIIRMTQNPNDDIGSFKVSLFIDLECPSDSGKHSCCFIIIR